MVDFSLWDILRNLLVARIARWPGAERGVAALYFALYFALCFPISLWSRRLERKLNRG